MVKRDNFTVSIISMYQPSATEPLLSPDISTKCSLSSHPPHSTQSLSTCQPLTRSTQRSTLTPGSGLFSRALWVPSTVATSMLRLLQGIPESQRFCLTELSFRVWLWHAIHICSYWVGRISYRCANLPGCTLEGFTHSGWPILSWRHWFSTASWDPRPILGSSLSLSWMVLSVAEVCQHYKLS